MDRDDVTDPNALIIYRLDQQDRDSAMRDREAHDYRIQMKQDLADYRIEIKATFSRLFDQVMLTNGRIQSLEKWKASVGGAMWAFGLVLAAIGAVVTWLVEIHK